MLLIKTALFFIIWIFLSWELDFFHLFFGFCFSLFVAFLNTRASQKTEFSIIKLLMYIPWLLTKILQANIHIVSLILNPRMPIKPVLLTYKTKLKNDLAKVILGNSITLTPGTITTQIYGETLIVHSLDDISSSDIVNGVLEKKIEAIFKKK